MAAKTVELTIRFTEAELETLDKIRRRSSRATYIKKLILEKGISKSGLPYTGDPDTDEILDDPEATRRLLDYERNPPAEEDLIPWEKVEAELFPAKKARRR